MALMGPPFWGTPDMWVGTNYDDQDENVPWGERAKRVIGASPDETLAQVIDRAAEAFRIAPGTELTGNGPLTMSQAIGGIAFYVEADERRYTQGAPGLWPAELLVVVTGTQAARRPWQTVTVADLLKSAEAGLVSGDPRIYLYPGFPQGDPALFVEWAAKAAAAGFELVRDTAPAVADRAGDVGKAAVEAAVPHLPDTPREVVDDAGRLVLIAKAYRWLKARLRRRTAPPSK